MPLRIRGGSGLGDSIYLRPIVEYLAVSNPITVLSFFPDVFLGCKNVSVEPFQKSNVDVIAHYSTRRHIQTSTQYNDMVVTARIKEPVPLRFEWQIQNLELVRTLIDTAKGRPIILVHGGRAPFGRADGYGMEVMPWRCGFLPILETLSDCFLVRIGKGEQYPLKVDMDLQDLTTVTDLLDLGYICDGVVTQCGYPVPLAECFDKPLLAVWSARGLTSPKELIRTITPQKILSKSTSKYVLDDWPTEKIRVTARRTFPQMEAAA